MTARTIAEFELYLTYLDTVEYKMVKRFAYKIANHDVARANEFMLYFIKHDLANKGIKCYEECLSVSLGVILS